MRDSDTDVSGSEPVTCPFPQLAAMSRVEQPALRNRSAAYREARDQGAVQWVPEFDAFFVLGRAEVVEVTSRPDIFSSCIARGRGAMAVEDQVRQQVIDLPEMADLVEQGYGKDAHVRAGLVADPPQHTRQRSLVAPAFRPARIRAMEEDIREVAGQLLGPVVARAAAGEEVELVEAWCKPFPLQVLARVLGVPADMVDDYARWSEGLLKPVGRLSVDDDELAEMVEARLQFDRFFSEMLLERRAHPQDDFLSDFVAGASEEGLQPLTLDEMLGILEQSVIAGHETTTKLMASAMVWLAELPGMLDRLSGDVRLIDAFVDEVLRLDAPSQYGTRQAMRDVELGGVRIPAGSAVITSWGAGNRDAAAFPDPDTFEAGRANRATHLGFGHGIHYCAGHALGRTEMRIGLSILAERVSAVELAVEGGRDGLTYAPSSMLHGPAAVPARLVVRESLVG
ncbi:cytochrome P450 [Nocardioides cavernae]|uniref:Cytochrome P450 n=1 Tax=Nocardioides cavernae TaxID=1921566 RepID=A0A7Y9KQQ8_9ACTN|nr:cytochrome P450 [Nocardioides cavernae]NYE35845.1 cytochrome P450 [Nocardioides cavernae]